MTRTPLAVAVEAFKALGHPTRLRIVDMLGSGPLSVGQITAVLRGAPSTVSAHLSELTYAGLGEHERSGRFVTYRLAGGDADRILTEVRALLQADAQAREDATHADRLRARGIQARHPRHGQRAITFLDKDELKRTLRRLRDELAESGSARA